MMTKELLDLTEAPQWQGKEWLIGEVGTARWDGCPNCYNTVRLLKDYTNGRRECLDCSMIWRLVFREAVDQWEFRGYAPGRDPVRTAMKFAHRLALSGHLDS